MPTKSNLIEFLNLAKRQYRFRAWIAATEVQNDFMPKIVGAIGCEFLLAYEFTNALQLVLQEIQRVSTEWVTGQKGDIAYQEILDLLERKTILPDQFPYVDLFHANFDLLKSLEAAPDAIRESMEVGQFNELATETAGSSPRPAFNSESDRFNYAADKYLLSIESVTWFNGYPNNLHKIAHICREKANLQEVLNIIWPLNQ